MQQYFYKKSNFKPTPGRHIKSYEQLQSLIHEAFMKILLKILKRKDRSSGIKKKKEYLGHAISGIRKRIPYTLPFGSVMNLAAAPNIHGV